MRSLLAPIAVTCLVLACACTNLQAPAAATGELHIGVDLPLTGSEARAAGPALNGIRFYVQQHPKLDGYDMRLVTADDAANANKGVENVRRFVADQYLLGMIGPFDSVVARKEIPVANPAGLAMISPATSNACLTREVFLPAQLNPARTQITCEAAGLPSASELRPSHVNNFFRLTTTDDLQGPAVADYAVHTLHVRRAAVITDHEAYGQGLAMAFSARLQRLGGTVVGRLELDAKNADARPFLNSMKESGAEAVYYGGVTQAHGCAIRAQMATIFAPGEATPYLSGDGIAEDPACIKDAGANSAGIYASVPIADADTLASATLTISAFKAAYGNVSDYGAYTVLAYDATAVLYAAIDRAIQAAGGQIPPRGNVVSRLSLISNFDGAEGTIGFDAMGDNTTRIISVFEPTSSNPRAPWKVVSAVDYTKQLPY